MSTKYLKIELERFIRFITSRDETIIVQASLGNIILRMEIYPGDIYLNLDSIEICSGKTSLEFEMGDDIIISTDDRSFEIIFSNHDAIVFEYK